MRLLSSTATYCTRNVCNACIRRLRRKSRLKLRDNPRGGSQLRPTLVWILVVLFSDPLVSPPPLGIAPSRGGFSSADTSAHDVRACESDRGVAHVYLYVSAGVCTSPRTRRARTRQAHTHTHRAYATDRNALPTTVGRSMGNEIAARRTVGGRVSQDISTN